MRRPLRIALPASFLVLGCAAGQMSGRDDVGSVGGFESSSGAGEGHATVHHGSDSDGSGAGSSGAASTGVGATGDVSDATSAGEASGGSSGALDGSTSGAGSSGGGLESTGGEPASTGDSGSVGLLDLSGYVLAQTSSAREYELPDGTLLSYGSVLVVGRDATQAEFEAFWGVTLGDDVVYLDTVDLFPALNGDETITLRDTGGSVVDGPSPALSPASALSRIDADSNAFAAWFESVSPDADATPGIVDAIGGSPGEPFVSEVVDAAGGGNYFYEYVEIAVGD